jgi:quinol monooxygenase YgiN
VFVRVWEFDVHPESVERFLTAYGADGDWAEMFAQASGYAGTRLYRDTDAMFRFITVDRWLDVESWQAFLDRFGQAYQALDERLAGLTNQRLVLEGSEAPHR